MAKSILLVTVDCLRADHVGFMGYLQPTTPFLDSLAKESFVVPTAIVAGTPTYYSVPAILASRFPLALGRDVLGIGPNEPTLASVLKDSGRRTAFFGAANPYISPRFNYENGFDIFRDFLETDFTAPGPENKNSAMRNGRGSRLNRSLQKLRPFMGPLGLLYDDLYFRYCQRVTPTPATSDDLRPFPSADEIVAHACDWLASIGDKPFFLWLHLMDPHSPYYPKDVALEQMGRVPLTPFRARYINSYWNRSDLRAGRLESVRGEVIALYDAGIRWVDEQIGNLVAWLRKSSLWEKCIFALTADHGEEFLEHGGRYHPPLHLMEELIHVPLLIRIPGCGKQEVKRSPFSLIHLAPTLLDAAEVSAPDSFRGRSYWPQLRNGEAFESVAISECVAGCTNPFRSQNRMGSRVLSIRESRYKLVLDFGRSTENLYDLEADPGEQSPLALATQKKVRRRLLEAAREHLRKSIEQRDWQMRVEVRLRELQLEWQKSAATISPAPS